MTDIALDDPTRPIVGIENRTAQEVFDIMCDRFRRAPPSQVAPQPQAGALDEHALQKALTAYDNIDAPHIEALMAAIAAYLAASPQAANPAQVTDANVDTALDIYEGEDKTYGIGELDHKRRLMRRALTAAIGAGGQAVAAKQLEDAWTTFCDCNPDDLTSPEDLPDHALMTCAQFVEYSMPALSQPHPADERVVEALRMAHSFIAKEYRDEKSIALEGEFVSKEARPVFRALSDALSAKEGL